MDSAKTQPVRQKHGAPFPALLAAPRGEPVALLQPCGRGPARLFTDPIDALSVAPADVAQAWDRLEAFLARHIGGAEGPA